MAVPWRRETAALLQKDSSYQFYKCGAMMNHTLLMIAFLLPLSSRAKGLSHQPNSSQVNEGREVLKTFNTRCSVNPLNTLLTVLAALVAVAVAVRRRLKKKKKSRTTERKRCSTGKKKS
jgi:hypothetical protein